MSSILRRATRLPFAALFVAALAACVTESTSTSGGAPMSRMSDPGSSEKAGQPLRTFPQRSLRGEMVVVAAPDVTLNGRPARLAPGSRIHGENNFVVAATTLTQRRMIVNYTKDLVGQVHDVWILSPVEQAAPWPRTDEEAQRWQFDVVRQTWVPRR